MNVWMWISKIKNENAQNMTHHFYMISNEDAYHEICYLILEKNTSFSA